ncbi:MAG: hypothetical protein HXY44_08710 [Syntrophaceae bacterium]|nr:hypothetical protein [Syntrophaceae bacterium]
MKKTLVIQLIVLNLILFGLLGNPYGQEIKKENCFFLSSLHYTAKGMEYWYDKANDGLEILAGVPYSNLTCKNCHVPGCDRCHKVEKDKRLNYSTGAAKNQTMCLECHAREQAIIGIDHAAKQPDVHLAKGMKCTDCHSSREMHGDGVEYISLKQPGAMDTKCEKCHPSVKPTDSHTVHGDKVDCKACHIRHVVSCTNCHFDTLLKEGKRTAIPVSGWVFLMNYGGKVTSANMQNFVVNTDKTFLMFAPHMSHSVMKEGRKCDGCHGTKIMKDIQSGKITLTWFEKGKVMNLKGVIPVVKGVDYQCIYQDRKEGKWVPIQNPAKPLYHYAAFGEPLSQEQLNKLVERMGK